MTNRNVSDLSHAELIRTGAATDWTNRGLRGQSVPAAACFGRYQRHLSRYL